MTIRRFAYMDGDDAEDLATLVRLTASERLHPEIGLFADWRQAPHAIEQLLARRIRGSVVLAVDGS